MKTYNVRLSRLFEGVLIKESIQVDAVNELDADTKAVRWLLATGARDVRILSITLAKRKHPVYLRLR